MNAEAGDPGAPTAERLLAMIDGELLDGPCWLCELRQGAGGTQLCGPCRAWLVDPASPRPERHPALDAAELLQRLQFRRQRWEELQRSALVVIDGMAEWARGMTRLFADLVDALAPVTAALDQLEAPPPPRVCARHGQPLRGGLCRLCGRAQFRRQSW